MKKASLSVSLMDNKSDKQFLLHHQLWQTFPSLFHVFRKFSHTLPLQGPARRQQDYSLIPSPFYMMQFSMAQLYGQQSPKQRRQT